MDGICIGMYKEGMCMYTCAIGTCIGICIGED